MKLSAFSILGSMAIAFVCLSTTSASAQVDATASDQGVLQGLFEADSGTGTPVFLLNNSNRRRFGTGGAGGASRMNQPVFGFDLPTLPGDLASAEFAFTMGSTAVQGAPHLFSGVVSLLTYDDISDVTGADFVADQPSDGLGNGLLVDTFTVDDVANDAEISFALTGAALTELASYYDSSGSPLQTSVFFRISSSEFVDTTNGVNDNDRYNFATTGGGTGDPVVTRLTLTAVPEPSSVVLLGAGFGFCFLRRKR